VLKRIACPDKGKSFWHSRSVAGVAKIPKHMLGAAAHLSIMLPLGVLVAPVAAVSYAAASFSSDDNSKAGIARDVRDYGSEVASSMLTLASVGVVGQKSTSLIQAPSAIFRIDTKERMADKLRALLRLPEVSLRPSLRYLFDIPVGMQESQITAGKRISLSYHRDGYGISREKFLQLITDLDNGQYARFLVRTLDFPMIFDEVYISRASLVRCIVMRMHAKKCAGIPAESTYRVLCATIPSDEFRKMATEALALVRLKRADKTYITTIPEPERAVVEMNRESYLKEQASLRENNRSNGSGGSSVDFDPGLVGILLGVFVG
jgi:hypothetical protein